MRKVVMLVLPLSLLVGCAAKPDGIDGAVSSIAADTIDFRATLTAKGKPSAASPP